MEELSCHPALLLVDILEVLFKMLPFQELKECRQVCRKWEKVSRKLVKNQSQLQLKISGKIRNNSKIEEFLQQDFHFMMPSALKIENTGEDLQNELLEDYSDALRYGSEGPRILNKLKSVCPKNDSEGFNEILREIMRARDMFWTPPAWRLWIEGYYDRLNHELGRIYEILGRHSFEEVQIHGFQFPQFPAVHYLLNILGSLSTSIKSLQTCSIPRGATETEEDLLKILKSCPLLTKLSLQSAPEWFHYRIFTTCPNITEINGNFDCKLKLNVLEDAPEGLTKIKGFFCSTNQDLEILESKSGNLGELNLEVEGKVGESIMKFVQTKSGSLKILGLKFREVPKALRLAGFRQLIKLHLQKMSSAEENPFCVHICFSKDTPQLKYFKLEIFSDEQYWEDLLAYRSNIANGGRVIPQRSLTHLEMQLDGEVGRECANYLRMLFPSLASLKITRPTEDFLRGLWQYKSLVELDIGMQYGYRRDSQNIQDLGVLFGTQQTQENEESILNLKQLRNLSIAKHTWNMNGSEIPDEIVRSGFGNMKRLAVLKLPMFSITPEAVGFLRNNLPFLKELVQKAC